MADKARRLQAKTKRREKRLSKRSKYYKKVDDLNLRRQIIATRNTPTEFDKTLFATDNNVRSDKARDVLEKVVFDRSAWQHPNEPK